MTDLPPVPPGARVLPAARQPFLPAVLRAITWKALAVTQALGLAAALLVYLQVPPQQPHQLGRLLLSRAVGAFFLMVAALAADEAISRGRRFWRVCAVALLLSTAVATVVQQYLRLWLGITVADLDTPPLESMLRVGLMIGTFGGIALLAYLNRQSALRMLAGVRGAELDRIEVERRLIYSRLATAHAQLDPATVLEQLRQIRTLYRGTGAAADHKLEALIQDLRSSVAHSVAASGARGRTP